MRSSSPTLLSPFKCAKLCRCCAEGAGDVILLRGRARRSAATPDYLRLQHSLHARGPTARGIASGALRATPGRHPSPAPSWSATVFTPPRSETLCPLCSPPPDSRVRCGWAAVAARMPQSAPSSVSRARPAPSAGDQLAVRACLGPRCPWPHSPRRLPSPPAAKGRVRVPP